MVADNTPRWAEGTVVATEPVTDRIRRLVVARPPSGPAPAGSHLDVEVALHDGSDVRSYSVVESNEDGSELTLAVLAVPDSRGGSRYMHSLRPGDSLRCTQPLQNFELRFGAQRHLLLAGGIGVTALVGMARVLHTFRTDYELVYLGRSRSRMAFADALEQEHGDRLRLHVDDEGSPLEVAGLVEEIAADPRARATELYMCGPIRLMDAVRRAWRSAGLPAYNLRFETFGSSGWFESEEFDVHVPHLGLTTSVTKDCTVLEALHGAGAPVMFDCRKGECGLCEVDVVDVDGELDHRDVFLSESQRRTADRVCTCVSRVARASAGSDRPTLVLDLP